MICARLALYLKNKGQSALFSAINNQIALKRNEHLINLALSGHSCGT
jgi:hypothetical protein